MMALPLTAADRLALGGAMYTPEERAVLSNQIEAGMSAEAVDRFWQDWAFASVIDRAEGVESWGRSRQSHQRADAEPDEQGSMYPGFPRVYGGGL